MPRFSFVMFAALALAAGGADRTACAGFLTREEAVNYLLAAGSGVPIGPTTTVWSPMVDFGFGPGYEGALPTDSFIYPAYSNASPHPSVALHAIAPVYIFWLDDVPKDKFVHATRFVFVAPQVDDPTVANGGIVSFDEGWWPLIDTGGGPVPYFARDVDRRSDFPAGFANPDGLIAGFAFPTADPPAGGGGGGGIAGPPANPCALIIRGSDDEYMGRDVERYKNDLMNVDGVPEDRINVVNGGDAATKQQVVDAFKALAKADPACEKVFIRWTSHGANGSLAVADGELTAEELCDKLSQLAELGAPVCMLIDACHSGSMLAGAGSDWDLPPGSLMIAACTTDETSFGGPHNDESTGDAFDESTTSYAFSQCKNNAGADADGDGYVSDGEAIAWVQFVLPCYDYKGEGDNSYPGGAVPDGAPGGDVSTPTTVTFGPPTIDRVIAKIDRGISKLQRALDKLNELPPFPPPELLQIVLPEVIDQLEHTIMQLEAAIQQLEYIEAHGGVPGVAIDRVIDKLNQAIAIIERAISKLQFILNTPSLPPSQVESLLQQVRFQIQQAIDLLDQAIEQLEFVCPGDANGDGIVNFDDVLIEIFNWGAPGGPADVNGDGTVNFDDVLFSIFNWGPCT